MKENLQSVLSAECRLVKDRLIVVGVSGGPDSLCLMNALRNEGYLIVVAHFDHMLRSESSAEARMVEKIAGRLGVPSVIEGGDVREYAETHKISIEDAARTLRYRFLFNIARKQGAQAVAVGHTADDQVETILMHFLRGSGISGLKGMSYRSVINSFDTSIPVVRPLLDKWREETVLYCAVHGLRPHYDASNEMVDFQRNRIRNLLIPMLETYNPNLRNTILRMSLSLKSDYEFIMDSLEHAWEETVTSVDESIITLDFTSVSALPSGLRQNLFKHAMQTLSPGADINYWTIKHASEFIETAGTTAKLELKSGLRIYREGNILHLMTSNASLPVDRWPQMVGEETMLVMPGGEVSLSGSWVMNCESWRHINLALEQAQQNDDPFQVWLDADDLPDEFIVRKRRSGDYFSPLGLNGHSQKISDFFTNEKLPRRARDQWPLLCTQNEIVWIPGFRPSHRYRIKDTTRQVLYFSVRALPQK
ncbi:MAG: tRNA lysidine(34) synthetase TilS [Anaerolineales bacterium]|nr:tRNA lysidine(34) synthetase TilS [Anaerolineales bacterium]MCB9144299.1 tRNA lysidine(34) synthetase TilS [Anaerolineales bacterium]